MRSYFSTSPEAAKTPARQYENYVGSRFLFRLSNELQSVKYKFSTRFSRAPQPVRSNKTQPQEQVSARNPLYQNNGETADANAGRPRPVIPSALVHWAAPGYDEEKTQSETYTGRKIACILIIILTFLSVIVGVAASAPGQSRSNQDIDIETKAPTNNEIPPTFRPSSSPIVIVTKSPSATPTRNPTASPTGGKTERPTRKRDDDRRRLDRQNRRHVRQVSDQ